MAHPEEKDLQGAASDQVAGQAELIVAKQRNGPIGDIELIWRKEFTRFENKAMPRHDAFDEFND